jgi:hypothetical protein
MTVSEGLLIAILAGIFGYLGSLTAAFLQAWKWKSGEQPKAKADAAGELTDTSLALVIAIRTEMESNQRKSQTEMTAMRTELAAVRLENQQMREKLTELEDVKEWAERLVHQVQSLGGEPVKMKVRMVKL